jgi:hypothetical protein
MTSRSEALVAPPTRVARAPRVSPQRREPRARPAVAPVRVRWGIEGSPARDVAAGVALAAATAGLWAAALLALA